MKYQKEGRADNGAWKLGVSWSREIIWNKEHSTSGEMFQMYHPEKDGYFITSIDIGMLY